MATLTDTHPTLLDIAKRLDPNGKIDKIVEMLGQTNEILDDMVWIEGNLPTGHKTTIRTGLPAPTWRKLYGGVQPTKSRTVQITDTCGMLEAYAEVDKALADLNGNTNAFLMSENAAFIEGMNQEFAASVIYANEATAPEEITGLAPRFNSTSSQNAENYLRSAASPDGADNTSIWLVVWGPNTVHGIYPKGSTAGLQMRNLGEVTIENVDGSNGRMQAYRTHYRWDCGLCVRDWRYIVRIMIDQEDLTKGAATGPDLIDLMQQATELVPSLSMGRPAFYMNRTVKSFLKRQLLNKVASSTLTMEMLNGKPTLAIEGIPVRKVDAILNTETFVS